MRFVADAETNQMDRGAASFCAGNHRLAAIGKHGLATVAYRRYLSPNAASSGIMLEICALLKVEWTSGHHRFSKATHKVGDS